MISFHRGADFFRGWKSFNFIVDDSVNSKMESRINDIIRRNDTTLLLLRAPVNKDLDTITAFIAKLPLQLIKGTFLLIMKRELASMFVKAVKLSPMIEMSYLYSSLDK